MSAGPSTAAARPIQTAKAVRPGEDVVAVRVVRGTRGDSAAGAVGTETAQTARSDRADGARRRLVLESAATRTVLLYPEEEGTV